MKPTERESGEKMITLRVEFHFSAYDLATVWMMTNDAHTAFENIEQQAACLLNKAEHVTQREVKQAASEIVEAHGAEKWAYAWGDEASGMMNTARDEVAAIFAKRWGF